MRSFSVRVSASSDAASVAGALRRKLKGVRLTEQDTLVLDQADACIEEFVEKAQLHRVSGTVIQIRKSFKLPPLEFDIVLESPDRSSVFTRIARAFRKDI